MNENRHVLVVEDECTSAMLLEFQLLKLGYSVAGIASSGEEAIQMATENQPDLVLMDIHLDGKLDGIETARLLRSSSEIPVVFLTATLDEKTLERARPTNPCGYLSKPIQEQELRNILQLALARD